MLNRLTRRSAIGCAIGAALTGRSPSVLAQQSTPPASYPIAWPERVPGDGFNIRHGFACENTWYNQGWWHCGEDWYALEGETAGAGVSAVGAGEVVFVGSEYPGRVVIVKHDGGLFSMYGHLDHAVAVAEGDRVERGDALGTVFLRTDGSAPSHLHFELRTFLTTPEVNGDEPRYDVGCGYECPPGPGYWPIDAPEHPVGMGWRNPMHLMHELGMQPADGGDVVVAQGVSAPLALWNVPGDRSDAVQIGKLDLAPGDRLTWRSIATRDPAAPVTSAEGYRLWYRVKAPDGATGWVAAIAPSTNDTGSDGRPSSVEIRLLPAIPAI